MAGTDSSQPSATVRGAPTIILVEPQLGENIGMAARAMLNCGLTDLRLVRPRDGWPNKKAVATAAGADPVIDSVRLYPRTEDAIADLTLVYAMTARPRGMVKDVVSPEDAAVEMRRRGAAGERVGVLFGGESCGLDNDDVALADAIITVPLNPAFSSLNLAQAVFVTGYLWSRLGDPLSPSQEIPAKETVAASKQELIGLFEHLERELDAGGFFHVAPKRAIMSRNLRNMLERARLNAQEVRTLRGVIATLSGHRIPPGSKGKKKP